MRAVLSASLVFSLMVSSCTHHSATPKELFEAQNCEEGLKAVMSENNYIENKERIKQAGGAAVSYTATAGAFVADVVVDTVAGVAIIAVFCAPMIAAALASNGSGSGVGCIPAPVGGSVDGGEADLVRYTKATHEGTKGLRDMDFNKLSQNLRGVAACYSTRNKGDDLQKAKAQLVALNDSSDMIKYTSDDERKLVKSDLADVRKKLGEDEKANVAYTAPASAPAPKVANANDRLSEEDIKKIASIETWRNPVSRKVWTLCNEVVKADDAVAACNKCVKGSVLPIRTEWEDAMRLGIADQEKDENLADKFAKKTVWIRTQETGKTSSVEWYLEPVNRVFRPDFERTQKRLVVCRSK